MSQSDQLTSVARERADKKIDAAIGELRAAAEEIGKKHGIPENISGHTIAEILGRMSWVPSMGRDLRVAVGQQMAKDELERFMSSEDSGNILTSPAAANTKPEPAPASTPAGMDVGDLDGITPNCVKALRENGLNLVGEVVNVPDEHLIKMPGLGEKSVAQLRAAIAKASQPTPAG